jgi:hypothetical protein
MSFKLRSSTNRDPGQPSRDGILLSRINGKPITRYRSGTLFGSASFGARFPASIQAPKRGRFLFYLFYVPREGGAPHPVTAGDRRNGGYCKADPAAFHTPKRVAAKCAPDATRAASITPRCFFSCNRGSCRASRTADWPLPATYCPKDRTVATPRRDPHRPGWSRRPP